MRVQPVHSTALAAKMAAENPYFMAISSLHCAEVYSLDIVDTEIQDGSGNSTVYIVAPVPN